MSDNFNPGSYAQSIVNVLSIAGSDPSGGAGIQADIKSISAFGGYALAAITALTAQNTQGVGAVHVPESGFLAKQLDTISQDIDLDAVKIGMLPTGEAAREVSMWLESAQPPVVVLDPVMVASSGDALVNDSALEALLELLPKVSLITPNLPELGLLLGVPMADSWEHAVVQGKELAAAYGVNVLVKGGHLEGTCCPDALVCADGTTEEFQSPRVVTKNSHGTGCSLSAALATLYAQNRDWSSSVRVAKTWLQGALESSGELNVGHGRGPINHFHALWPSQKQDSAQPFAQELWEIAEPALRQILEQDFIRSLANGSLTPAHFAYYLTQDALYLNAYSRVLSRASALAPNEAEQRFWAGGAQDCLEVELALHRDWLDRYDEGAAGWSSGASSTSVQQTMGPVTKAYTDHLRAIAFDGGYAEITAAVLPCFWLYAEVGRILHAQNHHARADHPYGEWLAGYADEAFAEKTRQAVDITAQALRETSRQERMRAGGAFAQSVQFEVDFFAAAGLYA